MQQTNRTILFEQINPLMADLFTLIGESNKKESLTDERLAVIHKGLAVSSFGEFMKKFQPSVNMLLSTDNRSVIFSLDSLGQNQKTLAIDQTDSLFQMLMYLIEAKHQKKYLLTGFEDMFHNVIPCEDFSLLCKDRNSYIMHLSGLKEENRGYYKRKLKKILKQYDDGIYLINTFINNIDCIIPDLSLEKLVNRGVIHDSGDLQVKVMQKASKYSKGYLLEESFDSEAYKAILQECLEELEPLQNRELLSDCFLLPVYVKEKSLELLQQKYTSYTEFYMTIVKKYWTTAKPLMETILGVWNFFLPYEGCSTMRPTLIVANFPVSDIMDGKNREKLDLYLNSVNNKTYLDNTVWYAIAPNLITKTEVQSRNVRERFKAQKEQFRYHRNETEEMLLLLEVLNKYRVQTFLSYALTEENTFSYIAKNGIDEVNDNLQAFEKMEEKDYLIPCFPNFTIISEREACLNVGKKISFHPETGAVQIDETRFMWLDEIGVEASYVAAGLVAACQCPEYLKKHYRRGVAEDMPGVAYRFSEDGHNLQTTTKMLSETTEYSDEFMQDAISRSRGLLFGQKDGKMIILTDRVFSYTRANTLLIAMVQTTVYMERIIQYESQDYKKNLINQFFQRRPGSLIAKWYTADTAAVNGILKEDERIEYKINENEDNCTFSVHFKNNSQVIHDTVAMFKE